MVTMMTTRILSSTRGDNGWVLLMVTMMTRILSSARCDNGWVLLKQGHEGALFLLHLPGQRLHFRSATIRMTMMMMMMVTMTRSRNVHSDKSNKGRVILRQGHCFYFHLLGQYHMMLVMMMIMVMTGRNGLYILTDGTKGEWC